MTTKVESRFAALEATIQPRATGCKMCRWLASAPAEDAEFIRSLLDAPMEVKGHKHISNVLAAGGVRISDDAVRNHRQHPQP